MKYGIKAIGITSGVYQWAMDSLAEAQLAARTVAETDKVEVLVFQIVGSMKPKIEWVPYYED